MPTLLESIGTRIARSRMGDALLGEERRRIGEAFSIMQNAYQLGPWLMPPEQVVTQLMEQDPWMVYNLLDQTAWEIIGGYAADSDTERDRAVKESQRLYRYNPLAQWSVWLWTSWGLGDKVRLSVKDNEDANEEVQEFFSAERNEAVLGDDKIKEFSRWLLIKGNRFLVFFTSTLDGETRVRLVDQGEIEFIKNPDDKSEIWFYKRTWTPKNGTSQTMYYPDWRTYFSDDLDKRWAALEEKNLVSKSNVKKSWGDGDEQIGGQTTGTDAYILFIPHNIKDEDSLWGWPILTNPRAWMQSHQHLMESRLTLAEAASMFVRRKKVTGGSRAVKSVMNTIASNLSQSQWVDTNPPATAGSVELDNAQIETKDLPLITGAKDTADDNKTFSWMALLGAGLFPTSAGLDTARWATALEMDKAQSMLFEDYRQFWSAQFRKMALIVLLAKEKHGNKNYGARGLTIKISIDTFSLADFPSIARTIGQFVRDAIAPFVETGAVEPRAVMAIVIRFYHLALDALGVEDASELTSDEAFGLLEEPEQEKKEEAQPADMAEQVVDGKVVPKGQPLRDWTEDRPVPITPENVARAIRNWERRMPKEARGILSTRAATPEEEAAAMRAAEEED